MLVPNIYDVIAVGMEHDFVCGGDTTRCARYTVVQSKIDGLELGLNLLSFWRSDDGSRFPSPYSGVPLR